MKYGKKKKQNTKKRTKGFYGEGAATEVWPRHLGRSVAKFKMRKAGVEHINSVFAWSWRTYVMAK